MRLFIKPIFFICVNLWLKNQHGIAKRIEAVAFLDGGFVRRQDFLPPGKGADQHDERGLGQVEVGDHGIHDFELVTGEDV